jgi:hypothetical protein
MTARFDQRLTRMEAAGGAGWRPWLGRPLAEWPDAALVAWLCHETGRPVPAAADDFPDDELRRIAGLLGSKA